MISNSEIRYVKEGVELNCRSDGRDRLSFRSNLTLLSKNSKFLPQCHGSSKVVLDTFSVECGVKCTIGKNEPTSRIVCDVQLAGNDEDREEEERHHTDVMNAMFEAALKDESMKIVRRHFHRSLTPCIILSYRMHLLVTIRLEYYEILTFIAHVMIALTRVT